MDTVSNIRTFGDGIVNDMGDAADRCRQRLVEIDVEQSALPADAFARKFELRTEADAVRSELADLISEELDRAQGEWAVRSARKGAHAEPDPAEQAARIVSPIEGGGGTG